VIIIIENFISTWLKDILIVFIVITFLEIILPKGKMKKFVNFIVGLLIIFIIISPFADLESLQYNFDIQMDELMNESDTKAAISHQEERIKNVFSNSLSEETKNFVEDHSNYEVLDININTDEEREALSIQEVSLTIKQGEDNEDDSNGEISIDKIQVKEQSSSDDENNYDDLENMITDYLGIDRNIIYINEVE